LSRARLFPKYQSHNNIYSDLITQAPTVTQHYKLFTVKNCDYKYFVWKFLQFFDLRWAAWNWK